ncbi:MAG TPA: hypothetical protein VHZ28_02680 [Terracidiphilus sp.]|jgi:hypothetical protein|nr:hypothetical protein [Terracidiphilus sp.]HEX4283970.1 hypothetical protein [Terracidiphilus sp.]
MRRTTWIALGLVLALVSQSSRLDHSQAPITPPSGVKVAPPTPMAEQKAQLGDDETWDPEWDAMIEKALPQDLLSSLAAKDVKNFCPRFNALSLPDKRAFWAYFFQALAGAEAGLRATANVRHTEPEVAVVDGVSHRMVRSEGLLQLTYQDADRYDCDFNWDIDKGLSEHDPDKTILQPKNNLLCGVKILSNQLVDQHKPLLTRTSYWSTLRPGWPGYSTFLKQMANTPEACGRVRTHRQQRIEQSQLPMAESMLGRGTGTQ